MARNKADLFILGSVSAGLAVALYPTLLGRPYSIDHFFIRLLVQFLRRHPMLLSYLRILEPWGLDFHSDDLDDMSLRAQESELGWCERQLSCLSRYDPDRLTPGQRLSRDVLQWVLEDSLEAGRFLLHGYPVNPAFGIQSHLPDFMIHVHQVDSARTARDYVVRVEKIGRALGQVRESLRVRAERGYLPPRFALERVADEIDAFLSVPPEGHVLHAHLAGRLHELPGVAESRRDELLSLCARALEGRLYPAYRDLATDLRVLAARAGEEDGAWHLPDGDAYYDQCLRHHTTTDMGADEVHETGLAEVARIHDEMRRILRSQHLAWKDPGATMARLGEDPRFLYPDTEEGKAAILADYKAIIADVEARVGRLFGLRPPTGVTVKRIPEFHERSAPGAYYQPASLDGSRPGIFFVNLRSVREIPRFGMRTLAYHEAVPGHHFQIGVATRLRELPMFRRLVPFTAYTEGWALYAEELAAENGLEDDPFDRLGYLTAQLFRAARLVVDTGIHAKRWTREKAIDYMQKVTGMPKTDVVAEVERYIVTPGQACAYTIGFLKIMELRRRAKDALGERFDIRAFHDLLLGGGALPLELLDRVVGEWTEAQMHG